MTHGNTGNGYAKKSKEGAQSHINMRLPTSKKAAYVRAAQSEKLKLSEWIIRELDKAVKR